MSKQYALSKVFLIACVLSFQFMGLKHAISAVSLDEIMADALQAYDGGRYDDAFADWNRAATLGNTDAMVAIANMYRQGEGRPKQLKNAAIWYEKAAKLGNIIGQMNYGEMLEKGIGVQISLFDSYIWYGRASVGGSHWATERQRVLGRKLNTNDKKRADSKIGGAKNGGN